jgi:hypothetical protein
MYNQEDYFAGGVEEEPEQGKNGSQEEDPDQHQFPSIAPKDTRL